MYFPSAHFRRWPRAVWIGCVLLAIPSLTKAQQDPGPRGGSAAAGGPFPGLNALEQSFFADASLRFQEVQSVTGSIPGEPSAGLGPTFNANSCAVCHAQPAVGGSSPGLKSPQSPLPNPQISLATLDGATNVVPPFITAEGPVREARFIATSHRLRAPLDGGVHGLYTVAGRTDAGGCDLPQPDFADELAHHNVVFRIPTPLYGLGLVEATPDSVLLANLAAQQAAKAALRIRGRFNTSGNDGTITRFGWKAQNKSLVVFSGEAYNVEQGVSNEVFPNERAASPGCVFNTSPEDATVLEQGGSTTGTAAQMSSDVVNFAAFIRLSAPPAPAALSASAQRGVQLFGSVGCSLCHSPTLSTGSSLYTGMSNYTYHPFSDFALHHMGSTLADGVNQGAAEADEFRTAPLWGVGQRLFFLHDGRTSDLLAAIRAHASPAAVCDSNSNAEAFRANGLEFLPAVQSQSCGSEANGVVANFNRLSPQDQQAILDFLRSL